MDPGQKYAYLQHFKKVFRGICKSLGPPAEFVQTYPANPDELKEAHPATHKKIFANPPVTILAGAELGQIIMSCPTRRTKSELAAVSHGTASDTMASDTQKLLQATHAQQQLTLQLLTGRLPGPPAESTNPHVLEIPQRFCARNFPGLLR